LLEYVQIGDQLSVFVVTDRGVEFVQDVAARSEIEPLLAGLRFQFDSLRYQPESIARFERLLKAKTDKYLESLGDKLIGPVRELIGGRDLIISPVSLLHYLPFHAFRFGGRYIVEERSVSYAPSASVWQRLRPARLGVRPAALLIGFADENIPHAGGEVERLRRLFRPAKALTGGDATFAAYQTLAPECDVLHFACHGQFRPDDPSYSSLHLADGWVTVKDICEQQLKAQVVTLSACETGLNEIAGGEEVIGLARGFLSAGAASIVLSLWTVNDAAAAQLTEDFYVSLQRGATVAASLRIAQTKLIDEGRHPYFWSPFVAIGK
jgi:CHAT domain-containing protein